MKINKQTIIFLVFTAFTLFFLSFPQKVLAATYDLSTNSNFNFRFNSTVETGYFARESLISGDVNGNGKADLLIGDSRADKGRNDSGSLYVLYDSILQGYSGAGNLINVSSLKNYNLCFYGAMLSDTLSEGDALVADLNGNGKNDILVSTYHTDFNGKGSSGSVYVIYDSLIDDYSGTGNDIDLSNPANYSLRFDGAAVSDYVRKFSVGDINGNGKPDIVIGAGGTDNNGKNASGSLYVIMDSLIDDYSGTGNNIKLATASNYNIRYDGAAADQLLAAGAVKLYDIDNNGKSDILVGAIDSGYHDRASSGSLYIIYDSLINSLSGTGNNIDLASASKYNLRYDGAGAGDWLTMDRAIEAVDLNNNGKSDLLIGSQYSDNNLRNSSGSVYIIYDSLIDDYSGTGNNIDLATISNYNLRYDGSTPVSILSGYGIRTADFDGNGKYDILVSAPYGDSFKGIFYIIYDSLIDDYSGTGNNIDLATASKYSNVYRGVWGLTYASYFAIDDFYGNGKEDLIIGTSGDEYSGSVWLIYNYPHAINLESFDPAVVEYQGTSSFTGTLSALDSVTNIKGIQYTFDNNSFASSYWEDCTANDSSFNSKEEKFRCEQDFPTLLEGTHYAYFRSWDDNLSYTALESYQKIRFDLDYHEPYIRDLILKRSLTNKADYLNPDYLDNSYDDGNKFIYNVIYEEPKKNKDKVLKVYNLGDRERIPSFTGWAYDKYKGGGTLNEKTFDSVATGPYTLTLSLASLNPKSSSSPNLVADAKEYGQSIDDQGITVKGTKTERLYPYPSSLDLQAKDNNIRAQEALSYDQETYQPNILSFKLAPQSVESKYYPYLTLQYDLDSLYEKEIKEDLNPNLDPKTHEAKLNKKLRFTITSPQALEDGFYLGNIKLTDKAGNIFYYPSFYLSLNYQGSFEDSSSLTSSTNQTTVLGAQTQEGKEAFKITQVEQSGQLDKEQGYLVTIKVIDKNQKPLKGVKVTLASTPRTSITNKEGIVQFDKTEPGDHTLKLSYHGLSSEQKLNLTGEVKEFKITVQTNKTNPLFNPFFIISLSILIFSLAFLAFKLRKK